MHVSFILFIKWELSTLILLGLSLGITTFSKITISKTASIGIMDAGTKTIYIKSAFVEGSYAKNLYIGSTSAVKHSEIVSQSF